MSDRKEQTQTNKQTNRGERGQKKMNRRKNKVLKAKSTKCKKETADFGFGGNRKTLQED